MSERTGPGLLVSPPELLEIRRRLNEHDWYARCFANLIAPANELLRRGISIPRDKGYAFYETCPDDNTPLIQDPFDPVNHPCPACGRNYTDEPYRLAWVAYFQVYLSQRALEMGIAYQLTGDSAYATAIRHVLVEYARHYESYSLEGCVLGPTRLFQSTYVESLWLANLAAAADLARDAIPTADWRLVRALFLASAEVIRGFDEGDNNRQAMNNAALGFVGLLCEEPSLVHHAVHGPHGWLHHLQASVLSDGLWYEGDNYHFASLPAMLNLAESMWRHGSDLLRVEVGGRRLQMMFDAPLLDLYPDLTIPSRKDARYASPIGQRWHAGMYEAGLRHYGEPAYARLLGALYAHPPAADDCIPNAAGFIDTMPSRPANREWLDWRGFLNAVPNVDLTPGLPVSHSADMAGTGLGILRADAGRTYASVDYGRYGGGHGHPDRLQLNLYARGRRWLTDFGTGNYFFDHLRWYRSTIGHNTVVVDGVDQRPADGRLLRFDASGGRDVVSAEVVDAYDGVRCRRTLLLLSPALLLDLFTVEAGCDVRIDWALHPVAELDFELAGELGPLEPAEITGEHYEWLQNVERAQVSGPWVAVFRQGGDALAVHGTAAPDTELYTAGAYGPPQQIPALFPVLIVSRRSDVTTFATLFEHRTGGRPVVAAFEAPAPDTYVVDDVDGDRFEILLGDTIADVFVEDVHDAVGTRSRVVALPATR